jgi:hypothetical protein
MPTTQQKRAVNSVVRLSLTAIIFLFAAVLNGQSVPAYANGIVRDTAEYTLIDWHDKGPVLTSERLVAGPGPMLLFADALDLRKANIGFAGEGPPRQATMVAREIILGDDTRFELAGNPTITWPAALAKQAAGKPVYRDGGVLVLITDTLRFENSSEPLMGEPFVATVNVSADGPVPGRAPANDGGAVVVFSHLVVSESLARTVCRPMLETADFLPLDAAGHVQIDALDEGLLTGLFAENNPLAGRLKKYDRSSQHTRQSLREVIADACRWEIENEPTGIVQRLIKVETASRRFPGPVTRPLAYERDGIHAVTSAGALAPILPPSRVMTLWSIAHYKNLQKQLAAATARRDTSAINAVLDRFASSPDVVPDPALDESWKAVRDPLRRAAAYYDRPSNPGSRIVTRVPQNVVIVNAAKPGCAFVVGASDDAKTVYLVTAGHVVDNLKTTRVTFWSNAPTPKLVAETEAIVMVPKSEVDVDLGLLAAHVPAGWSWKKDLDGDSSQLAVRTPVWSITTVSGAVLPALDAGTVRVPADGEGILEIEGIDAAGGNSGCPAISSTGIVGMLMSRSGSGTALALPVGLLRKLVSDHWGISWRLVPTAGQEQNP